ncbi:MAG: DegT/DnrJ/EryC1/StrS family aminotransferase [Terriglobia bacterium]
MHVSFLDLVAPHRELEAELVEVFRAALRSASFVGGQRVEDFESAFAEFCGTRFAVGVGSGTDALRFALISAGVGAGQAAITVPNTFIATAEAISQAGAQPIFVDVDSRTLNMDSARLAECLQTKCRLDPVSGKLMHSQTGHEVTAVVPVHLYGQPADMDPILDLASRYNLVVIEDACQAHGARYFSKQAGTWLKVGSMGRAAAFSFYPGKNLGACGEAGAVTTNDEEIARKIRLLRDHGQARKYDHQLEGYNGRLDAIQAGILFQKLKRLPEWNARRREKAEKYHALLAAAGCDLSLLSAPEWAEGVYHLYVVRSSQRDHLRAHLAEAGIETGIHYPIALHLQQAYARLGYRRGDFPVAEEAAAQVLSLPMYPQLETSQQQEVARAIAAFAKVAEPAAAALC